jgi:LacI family transcriptional regulator
MQAAAAAGVSVPEQLSVVGFDDIFGSELISPALTTVRAPLIEAGERAVHQLLTRIGANPAPAPLDQEPLHTELIVRGSTGRPRAI